MNVKEQLINRFEILQPRLIKFYSKSTANKIILCSINKEFNDSHQTVIDYMRKADDDLIEKDDEEVIRGLLNEITEENEIPNFDLNNFSELAKKTNLIKFKELMNAERKEERKLKKEQEKNKVINTTQSVGEWGYFDIADNYYMYDFMNDINQVFPSVQDAIIWIKKNLPRVLGIFYHAQKHYYIKATEEKRIDIVKNDIRAYKDELIKYETPQGVASFKLLDFINDHAKQMMYRDIIFLPRNPWQKNEIDRTHLQTFIPFKAEPVVDIDFERIDEINDFIYRVISASDEKVYNYILDWMACLVKHPQRKRGQCLVLYSQEEGTGKNSFVDFFTKKMFGEHNAVSNSNFTDIAGGFNGIQQNKLLCCINEASTIQDNYTPMFDKFKTLLTEDTQSFRKLYQDAKVCRDYCNYIITTNNENCIKVSETDRRTMITEVSDIHLRDKKYFSWLNDIVLDQYGANHYMTWLYNRPVDSLELTIPITQAKLNAQRLQMSKPLLFIEDCKDPCNNYAVKLNTILNKGHADNPIGYITYKNLYDIFNDWYKENGFIGKKPSQITFNKKVKQVLGADIRRCNKRVYPAEVFNIPEDCIIDENVLSPEPWN